MVMLVRNSDKEWEKFGQRDPFYGVLSHDKFRRDGLSDESVSEFFKSGQDYIAFVLEVIRASVDSGVSTSRALDFGCGVGRCSIPLTSVYQSVVGVDISDSMLEESRKNCAERSISNLEHV